MGALARALTVVGVCCAMLAARRAVMAELELWMGMGTKQCSNTVHFGAAPRMERSHESWCSALGHARLEMLRLGAAWSRSRPAVVA